MIPPPSAGGPDRGSAPSSCSLQEFAALRKARRALRLRITDIDTDETVYVDVNKNGSFWYEGSLLFMDWVCDQIPELRPAPKQLEGWVNRRKIYKRSGSPEEYLAAPFDWRGRSFPESFDPSRDPELDPVGDFYVGDDAEEDRNAVVGTDPRSDEGSGSLDAVVGEVEEGTAGQVELEVGHVEEGNSRANVEVEAADPEQ